jgi:hypothetical protein
MHLSQSIVDRPSGNPLQALRRFAAPRVEVEHCELCGLAIPADHAHLLEPATRQLHCCCEACSILFPDGHDGRFRRVPRRIVSLESFEIADSAWDQLRLPINLAFFLNRGSPPKPTAVYPSPAGPTEALLELDGWQQVVASRPVLASMQPEVEALLVNRLADAHAYYLVPIDRCYQLIGLIRRGWRGLSGGKQVWNDLAEFFSALDRVARRDGSSAHA